MFKLKAIKTLISSTAGRGGLLLKAKSPEILMVTGVIGIVASTVMACKATLKVDSVLDAAREKLDKCHEVRERYMNGAGEDIKLDYSEKDYKRDLVVVKVQTGVEFIKLYGPAIFVGVASIACVLSAHGIMKKRNLALMAAYKAVDQSFKDYRKRVVEEFGTEKDRMFKNGISKVSVTDLHADGTTSEKTVEVIDPNGISQYAKFFDEASAQWSRTAEYNLTFLKCQQNYANDLLHSRGHVFLNEVYDMIGVPRSQAGAVVGWVRGEGDSFIDFGIFDNEKAKARDFVNGYERSILLDFNVDGVIYDLI